MKKPLAIRAALVKESHRRSMLLLLEKATGDPCDLDRSFYSETLLCRLAPGIQPLNQNCSAIMDFYPRHPPWMARVGEWLSLVEHLVRDQGVGGSNPLSPTIYFQRDTRLQNPEKSPP
jgi:hypothetical protein